LIEYSTLEIICLDGNDFGIRMSAAFADGRLEGISIDLLDDMANKELCSAVVDGLRENTSVHQLSCGVDALGMEKRHLIPRP
jgi:hypothetical protein